MGKMLRQLYDGDIRPMEGTCPIDQECKKLLEQYEKRNDLLSGMLSEQGKVLLEEMIDFRVQMNHFKNVDEFVCGFKLGAKFILEILEDTP